MHIFDITPETGLMELTYPKSSWKKPHELYKEGVTTYSLYAEITGRNKFARIPAKNICIKLYDLKTPLNERNKNIIVTINPENTQDLGVMIYPSSGRLTKELFDNLFLSGYKRTFEKGRLEFLVEIIIKLEEKYSRFESVIDFTPICGIKQNEILKKYSYLKNV